MGAAPYPANLFCGDMFSFCLIFMLFCLLFFRRSSPCSFVIFRFVFLYFGRSACTCQQKPHHPFAKGWTESSTRLCFAFSCCFVGGKATLKRHSPMPANNYELCIMNYELFKRRCVRGSYGLSVKGSEPCTYHCHGYKEGRRCRKNFRSVKGAVHARNITYQ